MQITKILLKSVLRFAVAAVIIGGVVKIAKAQESVFETGDVAAFDSAGDSGLGDTKEKSIQAPAEKSEKDIPVRPDLPGGQKDTREKGKDGPSGSGGNDRPMDLKAKRP